MTLASGFVYVTDPSSWAPPPGLVVPVTHQIRGKRDLFGRLQKALQFPGYFGGNWDALNDCLHDLSWLPEVTHVTLLHDGLPFGPDSRKLRAIYLQLLRGLTCDLSQGVPGWTVVFPQHCRDEIEQLLAER